MVKFPNYYCLKYDWLGKGAYFYQEARDFAIHWARYERYEGTVDDPFIIAAEIEYDGFLDLLDFGWPSILIDAFGRLRDKARPAFTTAQKNQKHYEPRKRTLTHPLDRYVIELSIRALKRKGVYIRAVRAVFLEGEPIFDKSHLLDRVHIQIAVRDASLVRILADQSALASKIVWPRTRCQTA